MIASSESWKAKTIFITVTYNYFRLYLHFIRTLLYFFMSKCIFNRQHSSEIKTNMQRITNETFVNIFPIIELCLISNLMKRICLFWKSDQTWFSNKIEKNSRFQTYFTETEKIENFSFIKIRQNKFWTKI